MRPLIPCLLTLLAVTPAPTFAADPPPVAGAAPAAAANFTEILATADLLKQLRGGGYALYLRHGTTDNTKPDRVPTVDLDDCATQRPLNEDGRKLAARVGEAMRKAAIPLAEIRISPLCRVKDTAAAAGFPKNRIAIDHNLMYTANLTSEQKAPIIANTRRLLSAPVAAGGNRLLVAHAPNLMDLIGYFPKEGTLVVFRPKGNESFDYVASIPPAHWATLLK